MLKRYNFGTMPIFTTFSKRHQNLPDVYRYDDVPQGLRVQISHLWADALESSSEEAGRRWSFINSTLARELGLFTLGTSYYSPYHQCREFLMTASTENALDLIELTFKVIDGSMRTRHMYERTQDPDEAIIELNHRFREHGVGYQFAGGQLVKIDEEYIHDEAVRPSLSLLHEAGFTGAEQEFLKAHEHYRHGRNKEAIAEALKAFESTMKAIYDARSWTYPANATAWPLLDILFTNELIPNALQSQFSGLRVLLESGVPAVANKTSRHGQGKDPIEIPDHVAAYALHMAASNIVFLMEAHKAKK